jgi:hypothetical protein
MEVTSTTPTAGLPPEILVALRDARRRCKPVYESERGEVDLGKNRYRPFDYPSKVDVRQAAVDAMDPVGLELVVVGQEVIGEASALRVAVALQLVLFGADGQVVTTAEWESSVPLDGRDQPSLTVAAEAAVTIVEKHTLIRLLRMRVLPKSQAQIDSASLDADAATRMPEWSEPPTVVEDAEATIADKARVLDKFHQLGDGEPSWPDLVKQVVPSRRRPLTTSQLALVEAEIDRRLAAKPKGHLQLHLAEAAQAPALETAPPAVALALATLMATPQRPAAPSKDSPAFRCSVAFLAAQKAGLRKTFDEVVGAVLGPNRKDPANDAEWTACAEWLEEHGALLARAGGSR